MRAKFTLLVGAVVLTLSLVGALQVAAAAPAEHLTGTECFEYIDPWTGDVYVDCITTNIVVQENATPSGNYKVTANGSQSVTSSLNGTVVYTAEAQIHYNALVKGEELHVLHLIQTFSSTFNGTTCTFDYRVMISNGELRHERINESCS